ncbi:hypothetical protein MNBD_NITROSPINAE02-428 [hydrothermal vent metagenome]|uniref:DUF4124 domain-containing protein n=1 Tax=hydrothermal vent metagenome TaxID=652676 RepID=A0A3B1DB41_9ZZZZ
MTLMKTGRKTVAIFLAFFMFALTSLAGAQIYKTIDEEGSVSYTDNPCLAKEKNKTALPTPGRGKSLEDQTFTESEQEETVADTVEDDGQSPVREAEPEERGTGEVIVVGGKISIKTSENGYGEIRATIKNVSKIPVDGLRLDVILFLTERRRGGDLAIPFTGGKKAPSALEPDETGEIVYETSLDPEEITGSRFRLVWNVYELQTIKKVRKSGPAQGE